MNTNTLPILVQNTAGLALVEVDGQAVITAKNLAEGLGYQHERTVRVLLNRNKGSFRDGGIYDLSRGHQNDAPLPSCDTLTVRMITNGRPDGQGGGGLQDVRVFTKRGALKVCMKSNQPRAVAIQEMLIDLYEKVEAGLIIGAERFGRALEAVIQEVGDLKRDLAFLKSRPNVSVDLHTDTPLPITLERNRRFSRRLCGGLRDPRIRDMCLQLRRRGFKFMEIAEEVRSAFPMEPHKWPSKSAIHRFWDSARRGYLKEFGIDVTVH